MHYSQIVWGDKSTKNLIVDALTLEWPLSLKRIYNKVKKENVNPLTYQAVHKALKELVVRGIAVKNGKEYSLNKNWISSLKDFSARLNLSYNLSNPAQKESTLNTAGGKINAQFEFDTMWDMYVAMLDAVESGIWDTKKKRIGACQFYHFYNWGALLFSKKEYDQMKNTAKNNKNYMVGKKETVADVWLANFYKELGWKVKTGVKCANPVYDTVVHGDTIMQIYFDKSLNKEFERKFKNLKDISQASLLSIYEDICYRKAKIVMLVIENEKVAEQIHQQTRAFFKPEERYPGHRETAVV